MQLTHMFILDSSVLNVPVTSICSSTTKFTTSPIVNTHAIILAASACVVFFSDLGTSRSMMQYRPAAWCLMDDIAQLNTHIPTVSVEFRSAIQCVRTSNIMDLYSSSTNGDTLLILEMSSHKPTK
jgi:hypothetical protein